MKKAPIDEMAPRPKKLGDQIEMHFSKNKHALHFDHTKDRTRQEAKADTDIHTILRKHGVNLPPQHQRQGVSGAVDYDMNLQAGLKALDNARQAWNRIPLDIRRKFDSWDKVETAIATGKLVVKDGKLRFPDPKKAPLAGKEPDKKDANKEETPPKEPEKAPKE